jgi:predicted O-methyltransferase YrrM
MPPLQCRILYHLARLERPLCVLELGTCVGISAAYIATGLRRNGLGRLWTLEGSPTLADIADTTLKGVGCDHIASVVRGPFYRMLEQTLAQRKFDLVFIDGHHDGAATIRYFQQIKPHLEPGATVLFDDIGWSDGMAQAWSTISGDSAISKTLSHYRMGFALIKE